MNKLGTLLILTLLWSLPLQASQTDIRSLRFWSAPDHVRLVFDASARFNHRLLVLDNPHRLVLDLKDVRLTKNMPDLSSDERFIDKIRTAPRNRQDVRVVLDLKQAVKPKTFFLKPNGRYGHRLVIDIFAKEKQGASQPSQPIKTLDAQGERDVIIAVDAGHGGEDPGAQGRRGTKEKDVVLAISRYLARLIDKQKGMRAVLIRDGDYYLGLRKRIDKAQEAQADLFVSIHADAFKDSHVQGSSVYTLSPNGASTETARLLAESENSADLIGGVSKEDVDDTLISVLLDLAQDGTLRASNEAAQRVLRQLKGLGKTHKHRVQQAGFVVLKSPVIPSMLVETAFISNPKEERRLKTPAYQQRLAKAILTGIVDYFEYQPPPGTWLAAQQARKLAKRHVIEKGDTLGAIARQYQVSVSRLRHANELKGDTLYVGQELKIPGG
ncbi:MAG: N-acetylmuramoyl-L-alanine amidase [Chromatiales bacterium]|jgi:N-acetylmuramoyl-L-alanine amidase